LRTHPRLADVALAVLVLATGLAGAVVGGTDSAAGGEPLKPASAVSVGLAVAAAGALALRRRWVVTTHAVALGCVVAMALGRWQDAGITLCALVTAYTVGAHVTRRATVKRVAVATIVIVATALAIENHRRFGDLVGSAISSSIAWIAAFAIGDNLRGRRQRLADLHERNAFLERQVELESAQAATLERTRIARELHDIVAHSVSVMAVQAGGARRVVRTKPEQAEAALQTIETTARQTMDELRRLLGVLRTESTIAIEHAPQPTIADLPALVASDPDLPVSVEVSGEPRMLPSAVDLSAYRIVQEALTNVRKHAGVAHANVKLSYGADRFVVEVIDDGRGAAAQTTGSIGHGLTGMRERAALCGGTVHTGPRPGGGWIVTADLPLATAP
jgi:signal transduction histidine kinase